MINGSTKVVGIIGNPIEHTLSPFMHNAAFEKLGLNWCYLPFLVENKRIGEAVAAVRALNLVGINVTMPFKQAVIKFLDEVDEEIKLIQAVNTIHHQGGKLIGHNTDGRGFLKSLEEGGFKVKNKNVFVVGAGGAARSIIYSLVKAGVKSVTIFNRTYEKALDFSLNLGKRFPECNIRPVSFKDKLDIFLKNADIVINATPLGKFLADEVPVPVKRFQSKQVVCDLTTVPAISAFLREAEKKGCQILGGRGMLVWQGAFSFRIWTGKEAPIEVMKKALHRRADNQ